MTSTIGGLTESTALLVGDEPLETEVGGASRKIKARLVGKRHPGRIAGRYYRLSQGIVAASAAVLVDRHYLVPFWLDEKITITHLGGRVGTAVASGNFQLALYAANLATGKPTGAPVANTGDLSTTVAGAVSGAIAQTSVTLNPGLYFMAVRVDGTASTGSVTFQAPYVGDSAWLIGSATLANIIGFSSSSNLVLRVTQTHASGWQDVTAGAFTEQSDAPAPAAAVYALVSAVF